MHHTVMELVTFKVKANATPVQLIAASTPVNAWAQVQPGFQSRTLSQGDDETWFDVVFWESVAAAQAAAQKFMADLGQSDFMALIDPSSVKMTHAQVTSQV
jgi:hypothetical protein